MEDKTFELMTKMYGEFNKRFDSMENEFKGIKDEVKKNTDSIISLENTLEDTRKTLFDGYQQNYELTKKLENKIDDISDTLEFLDIKQSKTEKDLYKVQKQLKTAK